MLRTVELPLWLLILILAFAAVTFASHFLFPSVRWFFRRRMERVVARLNERLERPIQPFKLARRHDMIQQLIYDPKVMEAVAEHARSEGIPENVAFESARRYAREIVPSFSASAYFGFAIRAAKWLSTRLFRVRLGHYDEEALSRIDPEATVVFVMNHRSNMDYVLVTYLVAERSALSYAVGEWARIWPLSGLIRSMGAFFIRRKSRNDLYRRVLGRYVQLATAGGVTQAVFPEGGLSLDGRVGEPKLGLLSYIVTGFDPTGRDVVFVPVALNYDRVLEDRVLTEAAVTGERRFRGSIPTALAFAVRWAWRRVTGRARRFGYAAVSFGDPLSLREIVSENKGNTTISVGRELMARIRAVVPVLPVPLVSLVLIREGRPMTLEELRKRGHEMVERLSLTEAHVHVPRHDIGYGIEAGLNMLLLRRMVSNDDGRFSIVEKERRLLEFYAESIKHLLDARAAKKVLETQESEVAET